MLGAPERPGFKSELAEEIDAGRVPWDRFTRDGAAPYFLDKLQKAGLEPRLPALVRDTLHRLLLEQTGRNLVMMREITAAVAAMNARGIDPVLLKGAYLIHQVYTHPGFRRLADIDLLVRKSETATAGDALSSIGFRPAGRRGHHLNFTAEKEFPVVIELHHDLFNNENPLQRLAFPLDAGEFIDRSAPLDMDGLRARAFLPEDQILHLACHAAKERFGSLKLLVDFHEIACKYQLNWREIFSRAEYYNIDLKVYNMFIVFLKHGLIANTGESNTKRHLNTLRIAEKRIFEEREKSGKTDVLAYNIGNIEGRKEKIEALLCLPGYMLRRILGIGG